MATVAKPNPAIFKKSLRDNLLDLSIFFITIQIFLNFFISDNNWWSVFPLAKNHPEIVFVHLKNPNHAIFLPVGICNQKNSPPTYGLSSDNSTDKILIVSCIADKRVSHLNIVNAVCTGYQH